MHSVLHVYYADINAFKPADKIQHSPASGTAADVLSGRPNEHSGCVAAGPLSSTLLDVHDETVTGDNTLDSVIMKLFTHIQPAGL